MSKKDTGKKSLNERARKPNLEQVLNNQERIVYEEGGSNSDGNEGDEDIEQDEKNEIDMY